MTRKSNEIELNNATGYGHLVSDISELLEAARRTTTRSVNAIMTVTYWEIGRRIVEFEQEGAERAQYESGLLKRLSGALSERFGRGSSRHNLARFRDFYLAFPPEKIRATVSLKSPEEAGREKRATASQKSSDGTLQSPTTKKSAALSRISDDQGGVMELARRVGAFPSSLAKAGSLFGSELKTLMQELNEVLVS
jgi:hypothetical protein